MEKIYDPLHSSRDYLPAYLPGSPGLETWNMRWAQRCWNLFTACTMLFLLIVILLIFPQLLIAMWTDGVSAELTASLSNQYPSKNLLILRSWALLKRPSAVKPLDSFPAFYGTRRFNTDLTRALHLFLYIYIYIYKWMFVCLSGMRS
jgi:hypothetical protein